MKDALLGFGALEFLCFVCSLQGDDENVQHGWRALGLMVGSALAVLVYVRFA